ncbi:NAD(P)-dependent oxidoreductase [Rubrimonas cliftonensis]|uniref:D-3-phosphoglycerate dehydrogenase n=1 Tax=Rubrimonas cliftonensis TaxID=89524 RepID=A0A1H4CXR1_9RHOB|nr:NAD(P)-dependent oxidoreductase [Rubrimonas cliftonensis]SEA65110.1 D-3-phosphoglycerate dehydrogenase [Rubrimonas cliftonensis]
MTRRVLVSNIMMLNEQSRFDGELRALGFEPSFAEVSQYLDEAACLALVGDFDGWLAGDDRITRAVLTRALPRLRVIAKWGTGVDSIDLDAARELGVPVLNAPGAFSDAVAECAIGMTLMLTRHLAAIDRAVRAGGWPKPRGRELRGGALGLIGHGAIGRRIGELGAAFGMAVRFHDPAIEGSAPLEEIAAGSDVVCVACALTPHTRGLVDAAFLAAMRPDAVLVNVARGPIVDEAALLAALRAGRIAGAALDVFETEPLGPDHPLAALDTVVLGSHNANNGVQAVEAVHARTLRNLVEGMAAPVAKG